MLNIYELSLLDLLPHNLKNDEIENLKEQLSEEKSKGFFAKIFGHK